VIVLTLYTRAECHLCGEMLVELTPLVEGRARIEIVDIDTDAALTLRFGQIIPVLMHGDDELSRLLLDSSRVVELLDRSP
jgi:thioredoxin reductase (NADPH)